MLQNGFAYLRDPILRPLDSVRGVDAVLDMSDPATPKEADWQDADFIVGNPPFLGGKLMRRGLGDEYVDALFKVYDGRVLREADFVTYWFEKARAIIQAGRVKRAGLLGTQGIRGGASRRVLERIKRSGDIFMPKSDEPWILDGAAVRISFVAFDDGSETDKRLNGESVGAINANLTAGVDLTTARQLPENSGVAFMGDTKGGPFDIDEAQAAERSTMIGFPCLRKSRPVPDGDASIGCSIWSRTVVFRRGRGLGRERNGTTRGGSQLKLAASVRPAARDECVLADGEVLDPSLAIGSREIVLLDLSCLR